MDTSISFLISIALCFGVNFSCARASGTQAFLTKLTRNFIFSGDCIMSFFRAITILGGSNALAAEAEAVLVAPSRNLEEAVEKLLH